METIVGIDLGTTNSEIAVIRDGKPYVIPDEDGDPILPSVVGLDSDGKLLVGKNARNQWVLAPERTIRSIKRKMGKEETVKLGDKNYSPQEISAIILRTLKQRAEKTLGHEVKKAVITVPAFFNDTQRQATREAGELAGLEVLRIINEPTAASLTYNPHPENMERLLVYDLGGGTFDVSVVQVEGGVFEVLASHGDTQLGGDDFDQLLLDYLCDGFQKEHGIDLRANLGTKARVLRAAEDAKKQLSYESVVKVQEEFIAEKNGVPVHLNVEMPRARFESLIDGLLQKTLTCLDQSLNDAKINANQINKVLLVGGATRTPAIHELLAKRLGQPVHTEIEPDLCVAMGASVQGGLISGMDVGPVLVDITPHTLGIATLGPVRGAIEPYRFSGIIHRNTALPASRTESYYTVHDGQEIVQVSVYQGEDEDVRHNHFAGEFSVEGLADVPSGNELLVRLDLDLNGILKVTATERITGLAKNITIENAAERFKLRVRADAVQRVEQLFAEQFKDSAQPASVGAGLTGIAAANLTPDVVTKCEGLLAKAEKTLTKTGADDTKDVHRLTSELRLAMQTGDANKVNKIFVELEDLLFYLEDR